MECELERYYHIGRCLVYTGQGIEWTKERERSGERISEDVCSRILYNTVMYMEFGLEKADRARELILFGRCKV